MYRRTALFLKYMHFKIAQLCGLRWLDFRNILSISSMLRQLTILFHSSVRPKLGISASSKAAVAVVGNMIYQNQPVPRWCWVSVATLHKGIGALHRIELYLFSIFLVLLNVLAHRLHGPFSSTLLLSRLRLRPSDDETVTGLLFLIAGTAITSHYITLCVTFL
jgi:hypothetical protein